MSAASRDVFFYGLFMDADLLRSKGARPRSPRKAIVRDYRLEVHERAYLIPQPGVRAFGMVFAMTDREIETLYAEPGLEAYRATQVVAAFADGTLAAVTTFNLERPVGMKATDPEYVAKLRAVLARLEFPADYIESIG